VCTGGAAASIRVTGHQFGNRCPRLAGGRHGSWYVGLELPAGPDGTRQRIRRGGYPSRAAAAETLARLREPRPGDTSGRIVTVGDWLAHWLASRASPATSTIRGYAAHVRLYLGPYLGNVLLAELSAAHAQAMFAAIARQHQAAGSPVTAATLHRIAGAGPGFPSSWPPGRSLPAGGVLLLGWVRTRALGLAGGGGSWPVRRS
jgi:hypothetical protein